MSDNDSNNDNVMVPRGTLRKLVDAAHEHAAEYAQHPRWEHYTPATRVVAEQLWYAIRDGHALTGDQDEAVRLTQWLARKE